MASDPNVKIMAVRQTDDIHHVFIGPYKDKGHCTTRGIDCRCEPEVNIVRVGDEVIRIFIHDFKALPCQ